MIFPRLTRKRIAWSLLAVFLLATWGVGIFIASEWTYHAPNNVANDLVGGPLQKGRD
jgi:hypothetical protein